MTYLAINKGTAEWLLGKSGLVEELHSSIVFDVSVLNRLSNECFVEGAFRVAYDESADIVVVWNIDYLTGTGEESWGFIKIDDDGGLNAFPEISQEVFERASYVACQRLQGLLVEGSFIHRSFSNGAHTCLAGRGTTARQYSIGYYDRAIDSGDSSRNAIICIGPSQDFTPLSNGVIREAAELDKHVLSADSLIIEGRKRLQSSTDELITLRQRLRSYASDAAILGEFSEIEVSVANTQIANGDQARALGFSFEDWVSIDSPLSDVQRRILFSDAIRSHPLRIVGPAGSGKTLLMQLLALRQLRLADERGSKIRILYMTHNSSMSQLVQNRFDILRQNEVSAGENRSQIDIFTLAEYGVNQLDLELDSIIDKDAFQAKAFQLEEVRSSLETTIQEKPEVVAKSRLFAEVSDNPNLIELLAKLIMAEISIGIKGNGLESDRKRYVQSERALSRIHGVLSQDERDMVFSVFERYQQYVFQQLEVLDSDDIALSLLGKLRVPVWGLKRRTRGYDYVFVDETQLFNENERRVLPLLTNGATSHVPIVLALDEAQDLFGNSQSAAGLATLGIPDISNESLGSIHRSTREIIRLAFFVIQRSTDLFSSDFPDFTDAANTMQTSQHPLALPPRIDTANQESRNLGRYILKAIRALRKENVRQIAVVIHSDLYWDVVVNELKISDLPLQVVQERGVSLPIGSPVVVVTRPEHCGGQEFDAVIIVGLEQGVVPPRPLANPALSSAVEQQMIREVYLAVTRARYRVLFVLSSGATPNTLLQEAKMAGLVSD
jgi:superfamily I DNA/RNA helicase